MTECKDCCYYWKEDHEDYPHCHWCYRCPDDIPPCEYDEVNCND